MSTRYRSPGQDPRTTRYLHDGPTDELRCTYISGTAPEDNETAECPDGSRRYTYDRAGNLTGSSAGLQVDIDAQNRVRQVTPPGQGALAMGYGDVGQSERTGRGQTSYANGILGVSGQTNSDGERWAFSRDPRGALQGQRRLGADGAPAERFYYLTDAMGSIVAVTDQTGAVKARYGYDPFGVTRENDEEGVGSPWRWQGQYLDGQTGMYKMGERYYAPTMNGDASGEVTLYGRWSQLDPLNQFQDPRQNNRYLYAGQDPANFADPSGLASIGTRIRRGHEVGNSAATPVGIAYAAGGAYIGSVVLDDVGFWAGAGIGSVVGVASGYTAGFVAGFATAR